MAITINISDTGTAQSSPAAGFTALDAGSSAAVGSAGSIDSAAHVDSPRQAIDAGAPAASLVQEIEAALRSSVKTVSDVASPGEAISAGAGPI